jgi:hypothetical protein
MQNCISSLLKCIRASLDASSMAPRYERVAAISPSCPLASAVVRIPTACRSGGGVEEVDAACRDPPRAHGEGGRRHFPQPTARPTGSAPLAATHRMPAEKGGRRRRREQVDWSRCLHLPPALSSDPEREGAPEASPRENGRGGDGVGRGSDRRLREGRHRRRDGRWRCRCFGPATYYGEYPK